MNKKNQNHYERIYLEDENGNITFYGYKKENETIELKRTYSEKQIRRAKCITKMETYARQLGGFVTMCYVKDELLFNKLGISQQNIARLIYTSTYIDYNDREENVLIKKRISEGKKYIDRKYLKKILKLSTKTFNSFMDEMIDKQLLFEANGKIYVSTEYFSKGKCRFKDGTYTRLYINTTKSLYENCTVRQHRQLSYVYQLIPFMHFKNNVICKNPYEEDMCNVEKMNLKEICKLLGVNPANSARLEKDLLKFNVTLQDHKYYLFSMVMVKTLDGMRDFFVVNPSVIWKGTDVDDVVDIIDCMFFK